MDNNKDISYIVFEGEMARAERHIKRLWITLIVTVLLLFWGASQKCGALFFIPETCTNIARNLHDYFISIVLFLCYY